MSPNVDRARLAGIMIPAINPALWEIFSHSILVVPSLLAMAAAINSSLGSFSSSRAIFIAVSSAIWPRFLMFAIVVLSISSSLAVLLSLPVFLLQSSR